MSVEIDISNTQLQRAQETLGHIPGATQKALARAINRAISAANTTASEQIQGQYTIKNKKVISKAKKITRKATKSELSAKLEAEGRPIPLGAFITNPKKPRKRKPKNNLFAQVKTSGGGEVRGAFVSTVQTGHLGVQHAGVFIRKNGNSSLPIKQLYGPSVPQMLGNEDVQDFLSKRAKVVLDERLEHEIDVILRGVVK